MRAVGREAELAAIGEALETAGPGPFAIVIDGELGIGKTTVWRDAAALARARGYRILACRPAESETRLSFSGLADLMDPVPVEVLGTLPDPQRDALEIALLRRTVPPGTDHRAICRAVTSVVRAVASTEPVVIAVDDVQWLDPPTTAVIEFVVRRLGGERVFVLASTRCDQGDPLPFGLDQALDDDHVFRLRLGSLSPYALHRLLLARTGITLSKPELLRVYEASGGNPFFATEIASALARSGTHLVPGEPLPVPERLAGLVAEQVNVLPELDREALLFASALSHPTVDQLRAALNRRGTGLLDDAEESGIIETRDGRIRFRHPIFSSTIYAAAPAARRRRVHRRLAQVVGDVGEQAQHRALAIRGPDADVAAALETAARAAQRREAIRPAAWLWELANRRTPPADAGGSRRRTVAASVCLLAAGDIRRARSMLKEAMSGMTPGPEHARAAGWLAAITYIEGSPAEAAAWCGRGLAETGGDQLLQAALHLRASWFAEHDTPGRVRAAEVAVEILDIDQFSVHPEMLACALIARGYYRFLAGCGIDWESLARGRAMLPPGGRSWESEWARWILAAWAKSLDQAEARDGFAGALRRAIARGNEVAVPHALAHLAEIECWLGDWRQARTHAAEALAAAEQTGQRSGRTMALYVQALLDAHLNEIDSARETAERGLEAATAAHEPWVAALHLAVLGFAALSRRELHAADRLLSRADDIVEAMGLAEPARYRFHADHVEVMVARGDLSRAAALVRRLEDRVRAAPYPWLSIVTARSRAILRAAEGDLDAAIGAAGQALSANENTGMPFEHGRSLLVAGQIRRRRREKLLAREALRAARQVFDGLGASHWSSRAIEELRRLGLRVDSRCGLTPSEERVAHMAATGLTNREVASALFISQKTVEANLSRIFRKLGIRSRRELGTSELFPSYR